MSYPRHFDGLSGRPRASVSRRSPRSRAHRGHRAGFVEVGSGGDQGQHIEVSAGHAHQLQGLGLGRTRRPGRPHSGPVSSSTRATSFRAGELVDQGQRRPRAGHCRRLWERLWERRLELGANTYRVRVPRTNANPAGHVEKPARRSSVEAPRNRRHRGARLPRIQTPRPRTASFEPDTSDQPPASRSSTEPAVSRGARRLPQSTTARNGNY